MDPVSKNPLYLQVEKQIEGLLVRGNYKVGDRIPTESELVKNLGVSRVTVRSGLARLADRGLLERRRGSGTYLVSLPGKGGMQAGLERLETYSVLAGRLGVSLESKDLEIEVVPAGPQESAGLGVPEGHPLVRVSRTVLMDGKPAAWMSDAVAEETMPVERVRRGFRADAMLLDLLVSAGTPIGFSRMYIEAVSVEPDQPVGRALELESPSPALSLAETMYLTDGRPVQWSRNTFLPGTLNMHIVRELFEVRHLD